MQAPVTLASFLPDALRAGFDGELPRDRVCEGAILFADVSGFTRLAERAARRGAEGVEALSEKLRAVFGVVIDLARRFGGEVLRFAGDASIVVWEGAPPATARLAAACALALTDAFASMTDDEGNALSLHSGVGCGAFRRLFVGGVESRWEYLVGGDALTQACVAEGAAHAGEVVLSPACASALGDDAVTTRQGEVVRLDALRGEPPTPAPSTPEAAVTARARAFVPRVVLERLESLHARSLAELRRVSVLFASLPAIDFGAPDVAARVQAAVQALQEAVYARHGSVNQLVVDDKGTVLVAAWGLPTRTHEDDPARCLGAALDLRARLAALGFDASLGVTTGRVFCGERGNGERCEYGLIGHTVNLAARLMQRAEGAVLCDAATASAAGGFVLEGPRLLTLKTGAIEVWRALGVLAGAAVARRAAVMVGRERERGVLDARFGAFARGEGTGHLLVVGEAGIGKSRLLRAAVDVAASHGLEVFHGAATPLRATTPWGAWNAVFDRLLDVDPGAPVAQRIAALRAALARVAGDLVELAPLFQGAVSVEVPDNARTREMTGQVRADNTVDALRRVLAHHAGQRPIAVFLEDAHWMDEASWAFAAAACDASARVAVVLTARPREHRGEAATAFFARPDVVRVDLQPLGPDDTARVACDALGLTSLPPAAARLLYERSDGNPFFIEELAFALRDAGALREGNDLQGLDLPHTVEGVVASRIDRVGVDHQLTLKVASVLGRGFSPAQLRAVYPRERDERDLARELDHLLQLDLVRGEGDGRFTFRHAVTREVVYGLMLPSQRQALHAAAARAIEADEGDELALRYAELAHHWRQAADGPRALRYLELAGLHDAARGAYRESARMLADAVALDQELGPRSHATRVHRLRWQRHLGDAWFALGDIARSREHMNAALRLGEVAVPGDAAGWGKAVGPQVARQVWHLLRSPDGARLSPDARDAAAECAAVAGAMSELHYYDADVPGWLALTLLSVNLAEQAGRLDAAGRGYGGLGYLAGVVRAAPLARRWLTLGRTRGDARARAMAVGAEGLYHTCFGRWDEAARCYADGEAQIRALGDRFALANLYVMRATLHTWRGELARAAADEEALHEQAAEAANPLQLFWSAPEVLYLRVVRGDVAGALAVADRVAPLLPRSDAQSRARFPMVRAWVNASAGRRGAREGAAEALAWFRKNPPAAFGDVSSVHAMLSLYADDRDALAFAVKCASTLATAFPPLAAFGAIAAGERAWRAGDARRASASWEKAATAARRAGTPFYEGLAWFALRKVDARRGEAEAKARPLFERCGADGYLRRMEQAPGPGETL